MPAAAQHPADGGRMEAERIGRTCETDSPGGVATRHTRTRIAPARAEIESNPAAPQGPLTERACT
ncbi:hypothetical protein LUTEI9C_50143 [Luteimonas sp. 9C]|nr:hypothetical protein LUTEI9C_50143 [Luteimonas sp. 9C]